MPGRQRNWRAWQEGVGKRTKSVRKSKPSLCKRGAIMFHLISNLPDVAAPYLIYSPAWSASTYLQRQCSQSLARTMLLEINDIAARRILDESSRHVQCPPLVH
jgi:hypothetical protein